jgi:hypothetical protein
MTYLAILVLMLVAFTAVGWPLISSSRVTQREPGGAPPLDDLTSQRDAAYRGIMDLDFEHELGNLSESDYRSLRQRYHSEAAATLRKLDAAVSGGSEVPPSDPAASAEASSQASPKAGLACPSCGKPMEATDQYCWSCGGRLGGCCTTCGVSVDAGHRFCPGCGARLEAES